jgi:hypothetical protein
VTYLLEKSKTSTPVQDFYNLLRVETPKLWQTPNKKQLAKANKISVLENILEFAVFAIKAPAKTDSKFDQVEQLLEWGQKVDEDKTLPLAVVIKACCQFADKKYTFDLFIPVLSANQTKLPSSNKDAGKQPAAMQQEDAKDEPQHDESKPEKTPEQPEDNKNESPLELENQA